MHQFYNKAIQHFEIVITHESNGFIILHMKRKDFIREFYMHETVHAVHGNK